jgi:uncharacterized membrane protein YkvA (DUF1232 family)
MANEAQGREGPEKAFRHEAFHAPLVTAQARRGVRERFWPKLWRAIGHIPFSEDLAAAWYCAVDPRTAARVKVVLMGALAYFVVPVDLIPDLLVSVGFTDDATVLATALGVVGAHIKERHRTSARRRLGKPEPAPEED